MVSCNDTGDIRLPDLNARMSRLIWAYREFS